MCVIHTDGRSSLRRTRLPSLPECIVSSPVQPRPSSPAYHQPVPPPAPPLPPGPPPPFRQAAEDPRTWLERQKMKLVSRRAASGTKRRLAFPTSQRQYNFITTGCVNIRHPPYNLLLVTYQWSKLITLRAKLSGAVYCNRPYLFVCVCLLVCYHDNSKLCASIFTKLGL